VNRATIAFLNLVVWAAVAGTVLGAVGGWGVARALHFTPLDQLPTYRPATTTRFVDGDGQVLGTFALERRVELPPHAIPDHLKLAIVAIEDAQFYEHGGVDPKAVLRAILGSIRTGRFGGAGGASTLTQQLARNLFLTRERKIKRKIKEMFLALDMEKRLSKDQIITMYANQIYLGQGAYGVEAASQLYFGLSVSDTSLAQAAMLAGMIQNPERLHNPFKNPDGALKRRNHVLDRMEELGFVDAATAETARTEPLDVDHHLHRRTAGDYFLEHVRQTVEQTYGTDALYTSGLEVELTMDQGLQRAAERAVREGLVELEMTRLGYRRPVNVLERDRLEDPAAWDDPSWATLELEPGAMVRAVVTEVARDRADLLIAGRPAILARADAQWTRTSSLARILKPGDLPLVRLPEELPDTDGEPLTVALLQEPELEAALVALDNRSGAVLAMVGGWDFGRSEFNRAIQSKLQCGSAFKPFVYLTAFQQGYTPSDQLFDAPVLFPDGAGQMTYCPKNYYGRYYGVTTLRRSLELSFNVTAVKLQDMVGGDEVVETARNMGITTELQPFASLALGTLGVRLIDLTRAYAGFANLGEVPEPYFVSSVRDRDGRLLERAYPTLTRGAAAAPTSLLVHVLEGVVDRGTGQAARKLEVALAGKTGTTDEYSDAWFVGFTPRITVGVWVGRDLKAPIGRRMTGAAAALPLWIRFMESYLETVNDEVRAERFPVPAGVVFSAVDWHSGHVVVPACSDRATVVLEAFLDGTQPTTTCADDVPGLADMPWPFQETFYEPRPGEPMPTPDSVDCVDRRIRGEDEEDDASSGDD
jgi:penicillin-binding protein 1A